MKAFLLVSLCLLPGFSRAGAQAPTPPSPQEQVAALIREALQTPDDQGAWAGLAQGLAELDKGDGEEAPGLEAAVRVADSLAFTADLATEEVPTEAVPTATTALLAKFAPLKSWARGLYSRVSEWRLPQGVPTSELLFWPGALLLALTGLAVWRRRRMGVGPGWAFFRLIRTVSRVARGSTPPPPGKTFGRVNGRRKHPKSLALSLVETGMPTNEVARRTGMSQDEVSVLLTLHRSKRHPLGLEVPAPSRRSA